MIAISYPFEYVSGGIIQAIAPLDPELVGMTLPDYFGQGQPLTTFGSRAGVLEVVLSNKTEVFATVHHVVSPLGSVAVIQPVETTFSMSKPPKSPSFLSPSSTPALTMP